MSSAVLVTKQATMSPTGMIGPSWTDLREALEEADALQGEVGKLTAKIETGQRDLAEARQRAKALERKISTLDFQVEHTREANVALKRHNERLKRLLSGATWEGAPAEAPVSVDPVRAVVRYPNKNSLAMKSARARAVSHQTTLSRVVLRGPVWFDVGAWMLRDGDRTASLSPLEFMALTILAEHRGRRVPHTELGAAIFGPEQYLLNCGNALTARVQGLRLKLGKLGVGDLIPKSQGMGYMLIEAGS